jgi:hypothetical protein
VSRQSLGIVPQTDHFPLTFCHVNGYPQLQAYPAPKRCWLCRYFTFLGCIVCVGRRCIRMLRNQTQKISGQGTTPLSLLCCVGSLGYVGGNCWCLRHFNCVYFWFLHQVSSIVFAIAFKTTSFTAYLRMIAYSLLQFLAGGCIIASALWYVCNHHLKAPVLQHK